MDTQYAFKTIQLETFRDLLEEYDDLVSEGLRDLDEQRLERIPEAVIQRGKRAHITKEELVTLMRYYLSVKNTLFSIP